LGDAGYLPNVYIHAGGAVFGVEIPPIEKNREGQHMSDIGHGIAALGSLPPVPPQRA